MRLKVLGVLVVVLAVAVVHGGFSVLAQRKGQGVSPSERYIKQQLAVIHSYAEKLVDAGRLPDTADAFRILGQYGWHNAGSGASSVGALATLSVLTSGTGGSFGAYTFYQPAYEQAQRSWQIHGMMETGSDILWPMNANAKFTEQIIGYHVGYISDGPEHATVIGLPKYDDGSFRGGLQLDKKATKLVRQWGLMILPPDYVDMCACHP